MMIYEATRLLKKCYDVINEIGEIYEQVTIS